MALSKRGFADDVTIPAAAATRLKTLVLAAGYLGHFGATQFTLVNRTGATLRYGYNDAVSALVGKQLADGESITLTQAGKGTLPFGRLYVFSTPGGALGVELHTR